MQVLDEQKRLKIIVAAARLFATQPFHKVLLSEVAKAAGVGKGTLYTYFKSKEDLYCSVVYSGFSDLVATLRDQIDQDLHDPVGTLETMIRAIVAFAGKNPSHFEVMRVASVQQALDLVQWSQKRQELTGLIEAVIRRGVEQGVFRDPHPDWTARLIPGCVRSLMIDGHDPQDVPVMCEHILHFVRASLQGDQGGCV